MAGSVSAAKSTSAVWVEELAQDTVQLVSPLKHGDGFTVGYVTRERQPFALTRCWPNATTEYSSTYSDGSVWGQVFSVYEGGPTPQAFELGASVWPLWIGGGADCTVELVKYSRDLSRKTVLATTGFTVAP
jgi:hypothetical protein